MHIFQSRYKLGSRFIPQSILNDLQSEAEKIAQLVNTYQIAGTDPNTIQELQNSWAKEKKILLEAVKALRELVSRASNAACVSIVLLLSLVLKSLVLAFDYRTFRWCLSTDRRAKNM